MSIPSLNPIQRHNFPRKAACTLPPELSGEILPFLTPKDTNTLKKTLLPGRTWLIPQLYQPLEKALSTYLDTSPVNNLPIPSSYLNCAKLLATPKLLPGLDNLSNSFLISVAKGERGNTDNQMYAITVLSNIGYEDAVPLLKDLLNQRDLPPLVKEKAQLTLLELDPSEKVILDILPFFIKGDQLQFSCIPMLANLPIKALKIIIKAPSFTPLIKAKILTKLPSDSLSLGSPSEYQEFLLSVVKNPMQDMSLREKALQGIHQLPPLLSVIQSPDLPDLLKKQAISWIDFLMRQHFSPNREVGQALLQMLIELREERPEISGLNHKNYLKCLETYRYLLIQALGSLRYEEAESYLRELFNNDSLNPYEQKIIIDSLGKIGSHQSIPFLIALFKKSPPFSSPCFEPFSSSANAILYPAVFQALDNIDIALFDPSLLSEYKELLTSKTLAGENSYMTLDKLVDLEPLNALQHLLSKLSISIEKRDRNNLLNTFKAIVKLNTNEAMEALQKMYRENKLSSNEEKLLIIALRKVSSETSIQTLESIFNSIEGYSLFTLKQFVLEALCRLKDMSPLLQDLVTSDPAKYAFAYAAFTSCLTGADHLRSMIQNPGLSPAIKQSALKVLTSPSTSHTSWKYPQKALQNLLDLVTDASLEKDVKLQVLRGISSFLSSLKEVRPDQELHLKLQQTLPYFIQELNSLESDIEFKEAYLKVIGDFLEHPHLQSLAKKPMSIFLNIYKPLEINR